MKGFLRGGLFVALLCLLPTTAKGQTRVNVSGTVVDPDGVPYGGATIQSTLISPGGASPSLTPCTNPQAGCPLSAPWPSAMAGPDGSFHFTLYSNNSILPGGTQWQFTVTQPGILTPWGTGGQSFSYQAAIVADTDLSTALNALAPHLTIPFCNPMMLAAGCGGGGGGSPPAGNVGDLQTKLDATHFGASHTNDSGGLTKTTENSCLAGPRPSIDVTCPPYNADPTDVVDSTSGIAAAIAAACADFPATPKLFFPPGSYRAGQVQTPSTGAIFTIPCPLELLGGGGTVPQFTTAPVAAIVVSPGASPNAAAVFDIHSGSGPVTGVTFNHLLIDGYNRAVSMENAGNIQIVNSTLRAQVTGLADNTPLRISSTLWFWMKGGVLGFNNPDPNTFKNLYDAMFIGESGTGGNPVNYLIHFEDVTGFGGAFVYDQRVNPAGQGASNYTFRNVSIEDSANSFFTLTSTTGTNVRLSSISFDHARIEDPLGPSSVLEIATINMLATGVSIHQSQANGPNVRTDTSTSFVQFGTMDTCADSCSEYAEDNSGAVVGGLGQLNGQGGLDSFITTNANDGGNRLRSDLGDGRSGSSLRAFTAGSYFSTLEIDPALGDLFGDGATYGYTARLLQSTPQTLDIGFAQTLPPTSLVATPTTGGTLAAGTYYYYAMSVQTPGTCSPSIDSPSTMSLASNAAVVSGGNNAVTITWTPPVGSINAIYGYCVLRGTTPLYPNSSAQPSAGLVVGAGSTSITDLGSNFGNGPWQGPPATQFMTSVDRFTYGSIGAALGIGTLNPAFNLDVNGTGRFTGPITVPSCTGCSGLPPSPTVNGSYPCGYTVTSNATVPATCPQQGLSVRGISGAGISGAFLFSDNLAVIEQDRAATGILNLNLDTPANLQNPFYAARFSNHSNQDGTITPLGGFTINGLSALTVPAHFQGSIYVDPVNSNSYISDVFPNIPYAGFPISADLLGTDATGKPVNSGVTKANIVTQTSNAAPNQICTYTGVNKTCVPSSTLPAGVTVTGTSAVVTHSSNFTVATTDCGLDKLHIFSSTSAILQTLPQATGSYAGCVFNFQDNNTGSVLLTPTTSTIDGLTSITLIKTTSVKVYSDGTNWQVSWGNKTWTQTITATVSITNPAANTPFSPVFVRPANLPAGTEIHVHAGGTYDVTSSSTPNIFMMVANTPYAGEGQLLCTGDDEAVFFGSNTHPFRFGWELDCDVTVRGGGASGHIYPIDSQAAWTVDPQPGTTGTTQASRVLDNFAATDDSTHNTNGIPVDLTTQENLQVVEANAIAAITMQMNVWKMTITLQ